MNEQTYQLIVVMLGAIITGLLWMTAKQSVNLRDSIPPSLMPVIEVAIRGAVDLAKQSKTTTDDELIDEIAKKLGITLPADAQIARQPKRED